MTTVARETRYRSSSDWSFSFVVAAGVVAYLFAWPNDLGHADESYFLLEAKRISEGEVLYRDIFWFATPLAHWIMAGVFGTFGASIEVARAAMSLSHGLTAALLCASARRLGVRRLLAAVPPIAYLALCQAPFPYAIPHWFATTVMVAVLLAMTSPGPAAEARRSILLGLLVGALTSFYLQQGAAFFVVLSAWFVVESLAERRLGAKTTDPLLRGLVLFSAAIGLVVIPVLSSMIWSGGFYSVLDQVIIHPATGYGELNRSSWAQVHLLTVGLARYTAPAVLALLPYLLLVGLCRVALALWRRDEAFRAPLRLLAVCSASALSILYNPDFVHVGFIAAPFFVFAVETIEAGLRPLGDKAVPRLVAAGLSGALLIALAAKLWTNLALARASHPIRYDTAFGRVDLEDEKHRKMIARTRQLLERVDASQMFAYPVFASLYLTTGASNPTRFQLLLHDYNSPEHREEALNDLETKQVPLLVVCEKFVPADDPIVRFAREHYRVLHEPTVEDLPCVTFGRVDMDFGVVAKPGRVDPVR